MQNFEQEDYKNSISNMTNVNISGAVDQIFTEEPVMNPNIRCGVEECIHNSNYICNANGILIGDYNSSTSFETRCKTFRKR